MRKRNVHVQFWLDKKEAEAFNKKVKRSGLSREAYLRHLVNGLVPQDAPPPAYYDFMRELHRIGGNLNQIAQKAHVLGVIDERRYDEEMPEKSEDDQLLDELMEKPVQKEKSQPENSAAEKNAPFAPAAEKSPPSEPISESSSKSVRGYF